MSEQATATNGGYTRVKAQDFLDKVSEFVQRAAQLWNDGDIGRFCNDCYAKDAIYANADGMFKGLEEIREYYKRTFADLSDMGTVKIELVECRFPPSEERQDFVGTGIVILRTETQGEDVRHNHTLLELNIRMGNMVIVREFTS